MKFIEKNGELYKQCCGNCQWSCGEHRPKQVVCKCPERSKKGNTMYKTIGSESCSYFEPKFRYPYKNNYKLPKSFVLNDYNDESINYDILDRINEYITGFCKVSSVIVVLARHTSEDGSYDSATIDIYKSFSDANEILNELMYTKDSVDVYDYDVKDNKYCSILTKYHDSSSYTRLSQIKINNFEFYNWNIKTKIFIHF